MKSNSSLCCNNVSVIATMTRDWLTIVEVFQELYHNLKTYRKNSLLLWINNGSIKGTNTRARTHSHIQTQANTPYTHAQPHTHIDTHKTPHTHTHTHIHTHT